ncbi:hypothetical protein Ndes2526B_g03292 [Nannochloris sp. 'desiccata']
MQRAAQFCFRLPSVVVRAHPQGRRLAIRTMASDNSYYVLKYNYVPDILQKRGPYRAAHLDGAKKMADQNKLVMAGALTDPVDGAIFIFRNLSRDDIEAFVKDDPYVQNGLVPAYEIRPYMVVAGDRD